MQATKHPNGFLSVSQAARRLGISAQSVRNYIESGELESVRTAGGHRRILEASIRSYMGLDETEGDGDTSTPIALVVRVSTNKQGKGGQ